MAEYSFGERLLHLRKQTGLTQQAVADKLNIHRTSYTKYETGVVTPDHQGLVALAELFGVTVDYLVGHDEPSTPSVTDAEGERMHLTLQEQLLVQMFRQLNYADQQTLVQQVQRTCQQLKRNRTK
ncbi:MAG: helix-turn-helix domain-containing protein [Clostridia bacterium]|nr:helix-turn-helix domain-containing protein [Clostridia bacterium]